MKRFLSHCLAVSLIAMLAVGAPADVVETTNPRTAGGSGGGGGGLTIGDAVTGGTPDQVLFVDGSGELAGDADLTFDTDTLTVTKIGDEASICDNGDGTKCLTFEASGISAGQTRVVTFPNQSVTVVGTNLSNAWLATSPQVGIQGGVEAVTVSKTTTANESGETYTNTGDADGSAITLLNDPTVGTFWRVAVTVAQTVTISPSAGETLYLGTDQCLVSISSSTVGASLEIRAVVGGSGGVFFSFGEVTGWTCNDA